MTGRDILLGLEKLWTEGEHINASPTVRHAFHGALLLSGVGGWRPKSVTMVHYRNVQLYWVKHPKGAVKDRDSGQSHHSPCQITQEHRQPRQPEDKVCHASNSCNHHMLNNSQCEVYRSCSRDATGVPASHSCVQGICRQCISETFLIG